MRRRVEQQLGKEPRGSYLIELEAPAIYLGAALSRLTRNGNVASRGPVHQSVDSDLSYKAISSLLSKVTGMQQE
jgi:hypothetical protein